ncbi:MAG: ribosome biogenesis factor YjgA [Myxococcota bacterium]
MPRRNRNEDEGQGEEAGAGSSRNAEPRPSRTEQTRAAREVNALGIELTRLAPEVLDRLELPELLREEIAVCQGLKPRGRGRQNRLIGQLLRAEDHDGIRDRLAGLQVELRRGVQKEKGNERWLARILDEGESAIETLIEDHPDADRQRLKTLMRNARQEPKAKTTRRARRELLRAIRELRS